MECGRLSNESWKLKDGQLLPSKYMRYDFLRYLLCCAQRVTTVQTKFTCDEIQEDQGKVAQKETMTPLNLVGDEILPPSGDGCLYVEIST